MVIVIVIVVVIVDRFDSIGGMATLIVPPRRHDRDPRVGVIPKMITFEDQGRTSSALTGG